MTLNFKNSFIYKHSKLLAFTLKENKIITGLSLFLSIAYEYLAYYEYRYMSSILADLSKYNRIFSEYFSRATEKSTGCPNDLFDFTYKTCPSFQEDETLLYNALFEGSYAFIKYLGIMVIKPLLVHIISQSLTYSLESALIRKWLQGDRNSQLGLNIVDNKIARHSREIINDYPNQYISGIMNRATAVFDIIIALGSIYDLYNLSQDLAAQGLGVNLLGVTAFAMVSYVTVNSLLSYVSQRNTGKVLNSHHNLKNNLSFNMENALQVESSQATLEESKQLRQQILKSSKYDAIQNMLGIAINMVSMMFTNNLNFVVLGLAVPSIVRIPHLYFELEKANLFITHSCINIWSIFSTLSGTTELPYASKKIFRFNASIDRYFNLLNKQKDYYTIINDNKAKLSVNLAIRYPKSQTGEEDNNNPEYNILIPNINKTFEPGKIYAISGKSGSGKSSFFNSLIGINPFTSGTITTPSKQNIIYMPQSPTLKPNLNWIETIFYPLPEQQCRALTNYQELTEKVGIWVTALELEVVYEQSKTQENWTDNLSGGEAQRIAILQALVKLYITKHNSLDDNIILLLDEALGKLDPNLKEKAFSLIKLHTEETNATTLHIDHSEPSALKKIYGKEYIINFDVDRATPSRA